MEQVATVLSRLEEITQHTSANAEENAAARQLLESDAANVLQLLSTSNLGRNVLF